MRRKSKNILPGFFQNEQTDEKTLKNVRHYRDVYKTLDEYLVKYPEIEQLAHDSLKSLCKPGSSREREPDFTTQNLFRAVLVARMENLPWRDATVAIAESVTLQKFCRLFKKESINHHLLCQAAGHCDPEMWANVNTFLAHRMVAEEKITPQTIRADCTVVETNIHYPTDSSLCWDVYRTIARIVEKVRELGFGPYLPAFRLHSKKIKTLDFNINKFAKSKCPKRKKKVRKHYDTIIERTGEAVVKAKEIAKILTSLANEFAMAFGAELDAYLPWMERIVSVSRRRFNGEKVPNKEKVFSLFEPHTELIQKGKRSKPIEFGHLVLLSSTREKFITDCLAFEISPPESTLIPVTMDRHEELFGAKPKNAAMDKGFHPGKEEFEDLLDEYEDEVEYLGVPARINDFGDEEMNRFQRFLAGIEGTISFLKRSFGLSRCVFKGFRGFCRFVGSGVFCHNLQTMIRADLAAADT